MTSIPSKRLFILIKAFTRLVEWVDVYLVCFIITRWILLFRRLTGNEEFRQRHNKEFVLHILAFEWQQSITEEMEFVQSYTNHYRQHSFER